MDYNRASELEEMIQSETFYGIPISDIEPYMLDELDTDDLRTLYVIVNMLHWQAIDKMVMIKSS
jgi:hypothetical protein